MFDNIALVIGYAVMSAGGLAVACLAVFLAGEVAWKMWRSGWNAADIFEATAEWKRNHPERFKKWLKRNGLSED